MIRWGSALKYDKASNGIPLLRIDGKAKMITKFTKVIKTVDYFI